MATTYDTIARNRARSWLLVIGFMIFVTALGWAIGEWTEYGLGGLIFAFLLSLGMTVGAYYGGDRVALLSAGARGPIMKAQSGELWNMVENLSIAGGTPMPKLYLIDDDQINAMATGRDPQHASIAVTTGALSHLENEELEGVLAHELSHIKNYDIRYLLLILILVNVVTLLSRWFWYGGRSRGGRRGASGIFALIGLVLLILAPLIGQLVKFAVSRRREFLADASGALLTRYPEGLAAALEKIGHGNRRPMIVNEAVAPLFFDDPHGRSLTHRASRLFSTHPPIEERIAALRSMNQPGGEH